jgi:photosystem II stability/assembly factor-like uncharacterized protein
MKLAKSALLKKCVAIVCLLCSSTCGENKQTLHKPLVPIMAKAILIASDTGLKGVQFGSGAILDNDEIWLLGDDGRRESLYYSKDGGTSWQKKPFTDIYSPSDIVFTKDKTWIVTEASEMYYSTDRGDKWVKVITPSKNQFDYLDFYQDIGYAIVDKTVRDMNTYTIKPGVQILRTTDGGKRWKICYEDRTTFGVMDFALWQEKLVVVILNDKTTLWTDDQGKHWKRFFKTVPKFIKEVAFNQGGLLWGVAGEEGIYYSMNKGQSWKQAENLPLGMTNKRWLCIEFNKKDYGVCSASDGTLVITKNGGQTWEELKTTIPRRDSGDVMRVMMGEKFIVLNKNGEVYRIPLPKE